jgi:hypothetical protein
MVVLADSGRVAPGGDGADALWVLHLHESCGLRIRRLHCRHGMGWRYYGTNLVCALCLVSCSFQSGLPDLSSSRNMVLFRSGRRGDLRGSSVIRSYQGAPRASAPVTVISATGLGMGFGIVV